MKIPRLLSLPDTGGRSCFLWGPRKTGKTTWLKQALPQAIYIDLLRTQTFAEYASSKGTPEFGKSLEHLVWMELRAYQAYRQQDLEMHYWRTSNGQEVDFLLNGREVAVEVKSGRVHLTDCKGLSLTWKSSLADFRTATARFE